MKDPAGRADDANDLVTAMAEVFDGYDVLQQKSEADTARIKELEEANQRLFLSVTGTAEEEEEPEEEKTGIEAIEDFWEELEKED